MISRRKILALLGIGAPVVATAAAKVATAADMAAADAAVKAANPIFVISSVGAPPALLSLAQIRNFLLPSLWAWAAPLGFEADIAICFTTDSLFVRACYPGAREVRGFVITRAEILSNVYLAQFGPRLHVLRATLDTEIFAADPGHMHPVYNEAHSHPVPTKFPTGWIDRT